MAVSSLHSNSAFAREAFAVVLAGGKGSRLGALTREECKPALPFGCRYRTIDFSLTNCVNSGINRVGIATQYAPVSLTRHVSSVWTPIGNLRRGKIADWPANRHGPQMQYRGTADAIYQNWDRIQQENPRHVLVLAGDHVYKMDYRPMLEHHVSCRADMTVACNEVDRIEAREFGVMSVDRSNRVIGFCEKPPRPDALPGHPRRALVSMGIYVFNTSYLSRVLQTDARTVASTHDFGRDIISVEIKQANVFAYRFDARAAIGRGYWRDVGTPASYWQTHMDLLDGAPSLDLDEEDWPMWAGPRRPVSRDRPDRTKGSTGEIVNSLIGRGCRIRDAVIHRSAVCWNVIIEPKASLSSSLILPGAHIGRDCSISHAIVAGGCRIPDGFKISGTFDGDAGRSATSSPTLIDQEFLTRNGPRPARLSRAGRRNRYPLQPMPTENVNSRVSSQAVKDGVKM